MAIHRLPIGPLASNVYIIENGKDAIIVDPSIHYEEMAELIKVKNLKVQAILCTHLHFDHVSGVALCQKMYNVPVFAGKGDLDYKDDHLTGGMMYGFDAAENFEANALTEGRVEFGTISCQCLATPGHSMGGFCFYFENEQAVITGDSLFRRSIGRTDFFGGNLEQLLSSIREKLFTLPKETKVYPGHDLPSSIQEEMQSNQFFM